MANAERQKKEEAYIGKEAERLLFAGDMILCLENLKESAKIY